MRTRLVLAFILTVLIPLVGTSLYGNWITSRVLQSQALEVAQADLRLRRLRIEEALRGVEADLLFLSRMQSMAALLDAPSPENLARVQVDFVDFVATHPDVFQARYIDEAGKEVVRVDAGSDGLTLVPPELLQDKADRYYFRETMKLPPGAVFISPIDLNREFGRIQEPRTPTLRYATPVFTAGGKRAGLVIFNLFAEPLLQQARGSTLLLTDQAGYFLIHPNPDLEWGGPTDLNTGNNSRELYPELWAAMGREDQGLVLPQPANFWQAAWEFLNPFVASDDGRRAFVFETVRGGENAWRLINDLPRATLLASVGDFRATAALIIISVMLLATAIAALFARQIAGPIQQLTASVRRFGQLYGEAPSSHPGRAASSRFEIDDLTDAFHDMAATLKRQMEQLTQLNLAGRHIAARLEQSEVLAAVATAVRRLFPVDYLVISLEEQVLYQDGPAAWAAYRRHELPDVMLRRALAGGNWSTMALAEADLPAAAELPAGYLCTAPICVEGRLGLIELYGGDPVLGGKSTGELLGTLAVQASISLENAELVDRLARRRAELQALLSQLLYAQEEERRRIAYDIHDGLIQMLVGARLQLANAMAERDPERTQALRQQGIDGLGAAIVEARRVIEGLHPAILDDLGLAAAVRHVAAAACAETGTTLHFAADLQDGRFPPTVESSAFRIAQEAIVNAQKYAGMSHLTVHLTQENGWLRLTIRDDGRGFDPADIQMTREGGFGLRSMQERARLVGGHCEVERLPAGGTAVVVALPISDNE